MRSAIPALLVGFCLSLGACGDTLQNTPIAARSLEPLVLVETNPVYWVGGKFRGLAVSEVDHDPGGAYTLQYGNCSQGGQSSCTYPLSIVTSPDNSFLPGGDAKRRALALRGVEASTFEAGRSLTLATGGVVVDLYASTPTLALAAAGAMVPINQVGAPGDELPHALPDTGFAQTPLPSQRPPLVPSARR